MIDRPHQIDQLAMHDADQLLRGIERVEHPFADGILADALDELFGDVVTDIGLEQRLLDQVQPFAHVRFRQLPLPAQACAGRWKGRIEWIRT